MTLISEASRLSVVVAGLSVVLSNCAAAEQEYSEVFCNPNFCSFKIECCCFWSVCSLLIVLLQNREKFRAPFVTLILNPCVPEKLI